jgi:hypothetical protein
MRDHRAALVERLADHSLSRLSNGELERVMGFAPPDCETHGPDHILYVVHRAISQRAWLLDLSHGTDG